MSKSPRKRANYVSPIPPMPPAKPVEPPPPPRPVLDPEVVGVYVAGVRRAAFAEGRARSARDAAVLAARDAGATWTALADALGVTPQAVSKRYGSGPIARS